MNEATLRNYVRPRLAAKGVLPTHHEDALNSGIPDLSYSHGGVHGWIELKWLEAWPKREATIVRIQHYTKEQKHFLLSRGRAGGRCWLLLRIGRAHMIFNHEASRYVGEQNAAWLEFSATEAWDNGIDFEQLTRILTK